MVKPLLTDAHRRKRLEWAKRYVEFDWDKIIFTDELTFRLNHTTRKSWRFPWRRKIFRTVKHPAKVNVWGCFSSKGLDWIVCFTGNLDSNKMCSIYRQGLLLSAKDTFGIDSTDWILMEDNDPKHRSRLYTEWKAENNATVMPWVSYSLDQNLI